MQPRCLVLAAISILGACGFVEPFSPPKVIAGTETTVTLSTGNLRDASAYARSYCAKYGRRAVLKSRGRMGDDAVTLHLYDCERAQTR